MFLVLITAEMYAFIYLSCVTFLRFFIQFETFDLLFIVDESSPQYSKLNISVDCSAMSEQCYFYRNACFFF